MPVAGLMTTVDGNSNRAGPIASNIVKRSTSEPNAIASQAIHNADIALY